MEKNKTKPESLTDLFSMCTRRTLVTGAAAGIGRAIALRFAEAGANLDLVDIDERSLVQTVRDAEVFGTEVTPHVLDIADAGQRDRLWADIPVVPDILVNNAGIYPFKQFLNVKEDFYTRVIETNMNSVYWMCQQMIRRREKVGGVIINIASIEALIPFKDDLAHYSVSKAGVIALTRALAKEHGRDGFRINAILPGGIITRDTKAAARGLLKFKMGLLKAGMEFRQRLPIGRMGRPDEVARMAVVLASELSSYVHGAVIPVDGGFLAA